jgi:DNA-binding transcriptional MerR regulator
LRLRERDEMEKVKRLSKLPPDVRQSFLRITDIEQRNAYIKALRGRGWTLASISDATGMTRERVRQINTHADLVAPLDETLPIPELPNRPEKIKREFKEPSEQILARLKELQPLAQQVRSSALRYREEAEEYTALLWEAHSKDGVPIYRLAKRLGVTNSAIRFRLIRYGYIKVNVESDSKVYAPINPKNRPNYSGR